MLTVLFVVLILVALGGGWYGRGAGYGVYGWSPLGIILLVLLALYFFGDGFHGRHWRW